MNDAWKMELNGVLVNLSEESVRESHKEEKSGNDNRGVSMSFFMNTRSGKK